MCDLIEIGNRLYTARKSKGLKQIEVCSILDITQSTYSRIETGKYNISVATLYDLADLYDVPITYFFGDDTFTNDEMLEIEKFKKYIISQRKSPR